MEKQPYITVEVELLNIVDNGLTEVTQKTYCISNSLVTKGPVYYEFDFNSLCFKGGYYGSYETIETFIKNHFDIPEGVVVTVKKIY